ncbi:hypothetical protein C8J57DRAFT_1066624 [Mycena rebaudengoi]|nr:hypothetical protein C8J57DRAFT_1066624 [Mycena rebaudengoi]
MRSKCFLCHILSARLHNPSVVVCHYPYPATHPCRGLRPFNKLLHTLFPADSKYTVIPQSMPTWREGGDFIFTFHITVRKVPVFVLELKAPADLKIQSERDLADDHIRRQLLILRSLFSTPSVRSVQNCFYTYTQDNENPFSPPGIPYNNRMNNDVAPRERWAWDVLEDGGKQHLRTVVDQTKAACANL